MVGDMPVNSKMSTVMPSSMLISADFNISKLLRSYLAVLQYSILECLSIFSWIIGRGGFAVPIVPSY